MSLETTVLIIVSWLQFQTLVTSDSRGVMSPPALVDINKDGTEDVVVTLFNSTVVAVDGKTFNTLWNYTFPDSQTLRCGVQSITLLDLKRKMKVKHNLYFYFLLLALLRQGTLMMMTSQIFLSNIRQVLTFLFTSTLR